MVVDPVGKDEQLYSVAVGGGRRFKGELYGTLILRVGGLKIGGAIKTSRRCCWRCRRKEGSQILVLWEITVNIHLC